MRQSSTSPLSHFFKYYNFFWISYFNINIKEDFFMEEDTTKYGEFISSYFAWMTLEEQKEIARKLEEITKN